MLYNIDEIIKTVPEYKEFYTLAELDERTKNVASHSFSMREVGRSGDNHPIYLLTGGTGKKNIFIWGFPHPNEPIGSLMIDWLINYLSAHRELLNHYTWHLMYTADPDGTRLNEGWFKGQLSLKKYFLNFFRPHAPQQIDWTFPATYKDFKWDKSMPETLILKKIIDDVKPDLMYPLHNAGFNGAYFLINKPLNKKYYERITNKAKELGFPLDLGEPEEPFMQALGEAFYLDFGLKEYYEEVKKSGRNPKEVLKHGDNSASYITKTSQHSFSIKAEVSYFTSDDLMNTSPIEKTREEIMISYLNNLKSHKEFAKPIIVEAFNKLKPGHLNYYLKGKLDQKPSETLIEQIKSDPQYKRNATKAEYLSTILGSEFYGGGLFLGQVRRAALEAGLSSNTIKELEKRIDKCAKTIEKEMIYKLPPIRNLVQLQAAMLFETLNELSKLA